MLLLGLTACSTSVVRDNQSQVAFLNHGFAVVDNATADTAHDIALARPIFAATGFRVSQQRNRLVARDADTTIFVAPTSREAVGITRVGFVLNSPAAVHVERLGHSTVIVGPGARAVWECEQSAAAKPN